ncbi:MAG: hypothetical protein ABIJ21_01155 [Nanoarchaeota archaeon]
MESNIPQPTHSEQSQTEPKDISRRTIVILLVLVTLLSFLSTLSVMNEIGKISEVKTVAPQGFAQGRVQFTLLDPDAPQLQEQVSTATGRVVFEIKDK